MAKELWTGVRVSMESARAAAGTITGITLATPPVVGETAHGYANGDYITLTVIGMNQVNLRVFRVANVATDSYELEGIDSTNYDAFASGTSEKLTLGNTLSTVSGVTGSGGEPTSVDITTIHDLIAVEELGLPSAIKYDLDNNWDLEDAALLAMQQVSEINGKRAFLFAFRSGAKMAFIASVSATLVPLGSAQDKVTTPTSLSLSGLPTYYTT